MQDSGVVLVPVQLLEDTAFDLESYMVGLLKIRQGRKLNANCTIGDGSGKPTGVVPAASLGTTGASPTTIAYSEILNLEHSVDPAYRDHKNPKVGFMFADSTLLAVKKLTDSNSRPLWIAGGVSEGIQNRRPDTLDGWPFWINQDMSSLTSTGKSMLFGDFSKYKIRQVRQMQMVRFGERFMDKLQVGFLVWQRFDGNLVDAGTHPVRYFQNSAT
jgi:HK97 family phage major capsid protein